MMLPKPADAIHKMQLYRLLSEILDNTILSQHVFFKGGTCASILGWLDRFSVDLDFDISKKLTKKEYDNQLKIIFHTLKFELVSKSQSELFYVLKYQSEDKMRNTLKLSLIDAQLQSNEYTTQYLSDIDRCAICQTKETMFANKLVSPLDRWKKYKTIAGRDIYDIHHFFLAGYRYNENIIKERTGKDVRGYLVQLLEFIKNKVNETILSQDLNYLLPADRFQKIRKILKQETILLLSDEIKRLQQQ